MSEGMAADAFLIGAICFYLVCVSRLFLHVEFHHRQTWRALGEPWPWNPSNVLGALKLMFVGVFRLWHDKEVRSRAIATWVSFAGALVAVLLAKAVGGA